MVEVAAPYVFLSVLASAKYETMRGTTSYSLRLVRVPKLKQAVQRPLGALHAPSLLEMCIFAWAKCLRSNDGPVRQQVQI